MLKIREFRLDMMDTRKVDIVTDDRGLESKERTVGKQKGNETKRAKGVTGSDI